MTKLSVKAGMTTNAGRALRHLVREAAVVGGTQGVLPADLRRRVDAAIDAIEAEKEAEVRARLAAEVLREVTHDAVAARMRAVGRPWTVGEAVKATVDDVLALIQPKGTA